MIQYLRKCNSSGLVSFKMSQGTLDKVGKDMKSFIPMRRFGSNDEIKAVTLFLASSGANNTTGVILSVDGG